MMIKLFYGLEVLNNLLLSELIGLIGAQHTAFDNIQLLNIQGADEPIYVETKGISKVDKHGLIHGSNGQQLEKQVEI